MKLGRCTHQHLTFNWFYGREEGPNDLNGVVKFANVRCADCGAKFRFERALVLEDERMAAVLKVREERAT